MHLNINGRVTKENTSQTTRDKHGYEADTKQTGRRKPDITTIKCSNPVEYFYRRRHRNDQGEDDEEIGDEWVDTRHKHVVRPNNKG